MADSIIPGSSHFTPALEQALAGIADRNMAAKLEAVYRAADACVGQLRSVDLAPFEVDVEETADLGIWEQVAPAVGQILTLVSSLIATMREHFPDQPAAVTPAGPGADPLGFLLDDSLAEMGIGGESPQSQEASNAVRKSAVELQAAVGKFGMGVRNPEIVADRWALISHLQSGIGRFSQTIGDMVFMSVVPFAAVGRQQVVPYHAEYLKESLSLRRAMVDLARVAQLYVEKLKGAVLSEMPPLLSNLERDLNSFSKTAAYRALWAQDKREMLNHRRILREFAATAIDAELVRMAAQEFAEFVAKGGAVNSRTILKEHDREMAASCAVRLEQAESARESEPEHAALMMAEVLRDAWSMYGRDPELDSYLRKVKKRGAVSLTPADLQTELAAMTELVSRVPMALLEIDIE